jgi:hypothetical protein
MKEFEYFILLFLISPYKQKVVQDCVSDELIKHAIN